MKTIEINQPKSAAASFLGVLLASRKHAVAVAAMPEVTLVRPQVVLDAAHIARYASVCGFHAAQGVPLSYPQMLSFPLLMAFFASGDCPWPAMGTVHLANRVVQHQRLNTGDSLRVEVQTGRLLAHEKGQIFELELRVLRADTLVWEATQTLLRLGIKTPVGPAYASSLIQDLPLSHQADFSAPANIGRRYGRVSGDMNPIHLSALSARLFGFRRAIAHGLWTQARALAALLPREPLAQAALTVEFKTPLFLPARASLWNTREIKASLQHAALFEVRNAKGDKPHLRALLAYQ